MFGSISNWLLESSVNLSSVGGGGVSCHSIIRSVSVLVLEASSRGHQRSRVCSGSVFDIQGCHIQRGDSQDNS